MNANYIASLAFGLIVSVSSGAFFAVAWFASSLPPVGIA